MRGRAIVYGYFFLERMEFSVSVFRICVELSVPIEEKHVESWALFGIVWQNCQEGKGYAKVV